MLNTDDQRRMYLKHGAVLATPYEVNVTTLAEAEGVSRWTMRVVQAFAREHGPPLRESARIFVVGDTHAAPGTSQARFRALGRLLADVVPRHWQAGREVGLVLLGDHWDMMSLNSHTKGSWEMWNQTYAADVAAGQEALDLLAEEAGAAWGCIWKRLMMGNHDEGRIRAAAAKDPHLLDTLRVEDLTRIAERYGFETTPYKQTCTVHDIVFSHNLFRGGRPVTSVSQAKALLDKGHHSIVVGHHHSFSLHEDFRANGERITAMVGGCFLDDMPGYAAMDVNRWWNGVSLLAPTPGGGFSVEQTWTRERLREVYGV